MSHGQLLRYTVCHTAPLHLLLGLLLLLAAGGGADVARVLP